MWLITSQAVITQGMAFTVRPAVSHRALEIGTEPAWLGAFASDYAAAPLLFALPVGQATDRLGTQAIMMAGTALMSLSGIVFVTSGGTIPTLVIGSVIRDVGHLMAVIGRQAAIYGTNASIPPTREIFTVATVLMAVSAVLASAVQEPPAMVLKGSDRPATREGPCHSKSPGAGSVKSFSPRPPGSLRSGSAPQGRSGPWPWLLDWEASCPAATHSDPHDRTSPRIEKNDMPLYAPDTVRQQILAVLHAWGMPPQEAEITADVMVETDLDGIDSHGISMIPGYQRLFAQGHLKVRARPTLIRESSVTGLLDAGGNLGHPTTVEAMRLACEKAAAEGVGAVAVRRSHHFGAAGYYAKIAAEKGLIGLVTSTTRTKAVVPTRGTKPVLGTNPLAFAAPTENADAPFVLDMSTSTVAVNKVKVYDYLDEPLPAGWVLDALGNPVTDPAIAYEQLRHEEQGGLSPLGGTEALSSHKGYGLAVMVQILAGALTGAAFGPAKEPGEADNIGHLCLAISPESFVGSNQFRSSVSQIVEELRSQPPISPGHKVMVAGDREREIRAQRLATGIPLSNKLVQQINDVCATTNAAFRLSPQHASGS